MRDGRLDGTVQLTQGADAGSFGVAADLDATRLSVARAGQPQPVLNNESLKVVLRSLARADFSRLKIDQCDLTGSFLESHAKGLIVLKTAANQKTGTGAVYTPAMPLQMVRQLSVQARWTCRRQALYDAWSPAKPSTVSAGGSAKGELSAAADFARRWGSALGGTVRVRPAGCRSAADAGDDRPSAQPAASASASAARATGRCSPPPQPRNDPAGEAAPKPPAPPAKFIRGTANVALEISTDNDGRVTMVPTFDAKDLAIAVGTVQHAIGDATLKTRAVIVPRRPRPRPRPRPPGPPSRSWSRSASCSSPS